MDSERDSKGRFGEGNQIAAGHRNPMARRAQEYKQAIIDAVSESDITAIITRLKAQALQGDIQAAREILDRTVGRDSAVGQNNREGVEIIITNTTESTDNTENHPIDQ